MQIEFSVGAKAARLIGRENISDVDGALVELIYRIRFRSVCSRNI